VSLDARVIRIESLSLRRDRLLVAGWCGACFDGEPRPGGFVAALSTSGALQWARQMPAPARAVCATRDGSWVEEHALDGAGRLVRLSDEGQERASIPVVGELPRGGRLSCRGDVAFFTAWARGTVRVQSREVTMSAGLVVARLEGDEAQAFDYLLEGWSEGLVAIDDSRRANVWVDALSTGRANDGSALGYALRPQGTEHLWLRWSGEALTSAEGLLRPR
jgi:hypothetical protein